MHGQSPVNAHIRELSMVATAMYVRVENSGVTDMHPSEPADLATSI